MEITVLHQVMEWNEDVSAEVRATLREKRVCLINVMGSPGTGKTSLLASLIAQLRGEFSIGVIEGDITGQIDAEKIAALRALCRKLTPDRMDGFDAAVSKSLKVTSVWRISMEEVTGKAKLRRPG